MSSPTERCIQLLSSSKSSFSSKKDAAQRLSQLVKQHPENSSSIVDQLSKLLLCGSNDTKICSAFVLREVFEAFAGILVSAGCNWFKNDQALSLPDVKLIGRNRITLKEFLLNNDYLQFKPNLNSDCAEAIPAEFNCDASVGIPESFAFVAGSDSETGLEENEDQDEPERKTRRLQQSSTSEPVQSVVASEVGSRTVTVKTEPNLDPMEVGQATLDSDQSEFNSSAIRCEANLDGIKTELVSEMIKIEPSSDHMKAEPKFNVESDRRPESIWKYLRLFPVDSALDETCLTSSKSVCQSSDSDLVDTFVNTFILFFNKISSENWEERHGAAMGLKCFLQNLPTAMWSASLIELVVDKALKVVTLDRLSDFVEDETAFPVREILTELIIFLVQSMPEKLGSKESLKDNISSVKKEETDDDMFSIDDDEDLTDVLKNTILQFLQLREWNCAVDGLLLLVASTKNGFSEELFEQNDLHNIQTHLGDLMTQEYTSDSDIIRLSSKFFVSVYKKMDNADRKRVYWSLVEKFVLRAMKKENISSCGFEIASKDTIELLNTCMSDSIISKLLVPKPGKVRMTCFRVYDPNKGTKDYFVKLRNFLWLNLFNLNRANTVQFSQCVATLCRLPFSDRTIHRNPLDSDCYLAALLFCLKQLPEGEELNQLRVLVERLVSPEVIEEPSSVVEKLMQLLKLASQKCHDFELSIEIAELSVKINLIPENGNPRAYTDVIWVISKVIFIQQDAIKIVSDLLKSASFLNRKVALFSILYNQSAIRKSQYLESLSNQVTEMIELTSFVFEELKESYENLVSTVEKLDPTNANSSELSGNQVNVESLGSKLAKFESCKSNLSETALEALGTLRASYDDYVNQEKKLSIEIKALCACCLVAVKRYPPKISPIVNSLIAGLKFSGSPDIFDLIEETVEKICKDEKLSLKACEKFAECLLIFIGEPEKTMSNGSKLDHVVKPDVSIDPDVVASESESDKSNIPPDSRNIEAIISLLCQNKDAFQLVSILEQILKQLEDETEHIGSQLMKFCYFCRYLKIDLSDDFVQHFLQTLVTVMVKNVKSQKIYTMCVIIFMEASFNKKLSSKLFHFVFVELLQNSSIAQESIDIIKLFVLDVTLLIATQEVKFAEKEDEEQDLRKGKKIDSSFWVLMLTPVLQSISHHNLQVRRTSARAFGLVLPHAVAVVDSQDVASGKEGDTGLDSSEMKGEMKKVFESSAQFVSRLINNQAFDDCQIPKSVKASLRPYQKEGVAWLQFLRNYNLGGILADDMGLGKTLTCICLLADQLLKTKDVSLVVCPKSLIHHWKNEIELFCPDLASSCIDNKSMISAVRNDVSVLITSYDVIRACCDWFAEKFVFNYVILDEGHVIKNVKSKLFQAVQSLKANHRLVLTGTPIQNDVCELWTLFEFLIPSYLGSLTQFRGKFANPVKSSNISNPSSIKNLEKSSKALKILHSKVLPLILRREKENVLKDLPPKTIQDIPCDMSSQQKSLYNNMEKKYRSCASAEKTSGMKLLQLLLKICNQPSAVDPAKSYVSGKIEALKDLLSSIFPESEDGSSFGGMNANCVPHRALVFFQTKSMMNFVLQEICETPAWKHVSYLVLSGSCGSADRMKIVNKFNRDPSVSLLLCTTAVGGVGLNLTGADVVIFVEHDFNPVKDLQAMDRAHRIGQRRPVTVYRLITRDSVEENIMNVQKFKSALAKAVVNEDNTGIQSMDTSSIVDSFLSMSQSEDAGGSRAKGSMNRSSLSGLLMELDHLWTPLRKLDDL